MAQVQIKIDQAGKPPGVAGFAREDLATGTAVTATAVGGLFSAYLWTLSWRPIDLSTSVRSAAALSAATASATNVLPIDVAGTYLLALAVDSGAGLGAGPADNASITFYAGPTLASDPSKFPRRGPAFGEQTQHNALDSLDPILGNPDGWARERARWDLALQRIYEGKTWASGRVHLSAGGASLIRGQNVASVVRTALGTVAVTFATALLDASYGVVHSPRGSAGMTAHDTESGSGFTLYRADVGGTLVDADFAFDVKLGT